MSSGRSRDPAKAVVKPLNAGDLQPARISTGETLRSSQLRRIHTSVLFRISEHFRKGSPVSDHRFLVTRGICACPRTREVSVPVDKDNSLIFVAASRNERPVIRIPEFAAERPKTLYRLPASLPVDLAVTAICMFGHRSREMRFEETQIPSVGRPRREGTRRVRLRRSSKRSQGSELAAVLRRTVERLFRPINPS
jgi:hypothetical protein